MTLYGRLKTFLARHMLVHEFCHDCGLAVRQVWTADNDLWWRILGSDSGPRCIGCFTRRANDVRLFIQWLPYVENGNEKAQRVKQEPRIPPEAEAEKTTTRRTETHEPKEVTRSPPP